MSHRRINSRSVNALPSSRTWKAMKAGMDTFTKGTRWGLGRDSNLKFWYDSWASKGPLRGITNALLIRGEDVLNIRDVASANRWEWRKISIVLPTNIQKEIQAMPRSWVSNEEDRLIWAASSNGNFNLNSAYLLADQFDNSVSTFNGKWIWKINTLPRVQSFIWMCFHESLATRERLASRGMQIETSCPLCLQAPESIIHMLRDCYLASNCWQSISDGNINPDFASMDLQRWLEDNCKSQKRHQANFLPWSTLFSFEIWTIWQHRNKVVFKNQPPCQTIHREVIQRASKFVFCAQDYAGFKINIE